LEILIEGIEKEGTNFRAGLVPAEMQVKIVLWTILLTRLERGFP